jgi:DNA repair protein RecO (recombination protein O)
MTDNIIHLQPAFILKQRQYRESSLIIDVFTQDFGKVSLVAKGVRKTKSKTAGLLQPFIPLNLSYLGRGELKTLTHVELAKPYLQLTGLSLYCGFYVNELIACLLLTEDPHPEVFNLYENCLTDLLKSDQIEATLRLFELDLIEAIGYGLQLAYDLQHHKTLSPEARYHFDIEQGPIESPEGHFSGQTLISLQTRTLEDPKILYEAKLLMRHVINHYLHGKPLKSRAVINQIIKHL